MKENRAFFILDLRLGEWRIVKLKKVIIEEKAIMREQEKVLMVVHSLKIRFDTKSLGVALERASHLGSIQK